MAKVVRGMKRLIARRKFFTIKLKNSDIAIDCGANVGDITQHLSKYGATIYAFEPNPYAFQILKGRFLKNKNVNCIQKGVLDKNEMRKLYLHKFSGKDEVYWSGGSSFLSFKENVLKDKYLEVPVIDLCEFITSLKSRIRILKMDVEGVECRILKK